jgi:N-acetylglutamate synthase-like GNAT family acetyltransferase
MQENMEFRRITDSELDEAYAVICDAVEWLNAKDIQQWPSPIPRRSYERMQARGQNYALFCEGRIAVVLSLAPGRNPHWKGVVDEEVTWLRTVATGQDARGTGAGREALAAAACEVAAAGATELYVDCVYGDGFLPRYYESVGFEQLARREITYLTGTFDMVLLRKTLVENQVLPQG